MITKVKLRRSFAPLTIAAKLVCDSPNSSAVQYYDVPGEKYIVDRTVVPLRVAPVLSINAIDGSWKEANANKYLANFRWLMDGVALTMDGSDFEMVADETYKFVLLVKKNFSIDESHSIQLEAVLVDPRTAENVPIRTDVFTISTCAKAEDGYTIQTNGSDNVVYNALNDKTLADDFFASHPHRSGSTEGLTDSYLFATEFRLLKGTTMLSSEDFTAKIYSKPATGGAWTEETAGRGLLRSLTPGRAVLDLRLADQTVVSVAALVDGVEVARTTLCTIRRERPSYAVSILNDEEISHDQIRHVDECVVSGDGIVYDAAENVLALRWLTTTAKKVDTFVGEGRKVDFDLIAEAGIGPNEMTGWVAESIESEYKGAYALATDDEGNELTDENGDYLIFV